MAIPGGGGQQSVQKGTCLRLIASRIGVDAAREDSILLLLLPKKPLLLELSRETFDVVLRARPDRDKDRYWATQAHYSRGSEKAKKVQRIRVCRCTHFCIDILLHRIIVFNLSKVGVDQSTCLEDGEFICSELL